MEIPISKLKEFGNSIEPAQQELSFLTQSKYRDAFRATKAGAVLVSEAPESSHTNLLICENPYLALAQIAQALYPKPVFEAGVHPTAFIHATAQVDPTVHVGANAVVDADAVLGAGSVIEALCYVGRECVIGANVHIHPGSRVLNKTRIGDRTILHAGCVIGSDGFGFAPDAQGTRHKVPQVGIVEIGADCEIGANTTIDRATLGVTKVGSGTKLDNLVQIAHNVELGDNCVMASQSGIAGSSRLGDQVVMGAQSGLSGHVAVCDNTILAARAGVISDIKKPGVFAGFPSMPHKDWLRYKAQRKRLADLRRTVARHDKLIADLAMEE